MRAARPSALNLQATELGGAAYDAVERTTKALGLEGGLQGVTKGLEGLGGAVSDAARQASQAAGFPPPQAWPPPVSGAGASAAADGPPPEFSPSPAETDALVSSAYAVPRNLVLRMATDEIDQSFGLATLLKARYAQVWEVQGGGRLDYRSMPGTHITPNLPDLRAIDWRMAGLLGLPELVVGQTREVADRLAFEQEAACAVVAGFVLKEAQVCEEERVAAQGD